MYPNVRNDGGSVVEIRCSVDAAVLIRDALDALNPESGSEGEYLRDVLAAQLTAAVTA